MVDEKIEIKNRIVETAHKLFEHYGYNKTTVEDIAEEAGIGKGSIYLYFKSKQDILIEVVLAYIQCVMVEIKKVYNSDLPIKKKFIELIKTKYFTTYQYCSNTPHGHEISYNMRFVNEDIYKAAGKYREELINMFAGLIEEGNKSGILDVADPHKTSKYILISFEILYPSYRIKMWESEEEVLDYIINLVNLYFDGMRKRKISDNFL